LAPQQLPRIHPQTDRVFLLRNISVRLLPVLSDGASNPKNEFKFQNTALEQTNKCIARYVDIFGCRDGPARDNHVARTAIGFFFFKLVTQRLE
jgi:hypothetical protein